MRDILANTINMKKEKKLGNKLQKELLEKSDLLETCFHQKRAP